MMLTEEQVLELWKDGKIFEKSLAKDAPNGSYVFYDGPPFATGLPHYGHILVSAIKDAVPRYQTMRGKYVERKWGWDCHGLPIENIAEKDLGISGKKEIEKLGIEKFNSHARSKVLQYIDEWKRTVDRIGRWVDFDNSYKTMDTSYIESVWWALKDIYNKDLIYQGNRVLPYCPRCETPIANSEIAMDNSYKDITDISVFVKLELVNEPGTFLVAWTTTPWTLPGNTAAAVREDIEYIKVKDQKEAGTEYYILAKDRFEMVEKFFSNPEIVENFTGDKLIGLSYTPPFNYFSNDNLENKENGWKVYNAAYVTTESGTGIVHLAPNYGEEDMELAKKYSIPLIHHVAQDGTFVDKVVDFAGRKVKPKDNHQETDIEIIKFLAHHNRLFAKEKIIHSYPHCFRCETPLYYNALPAWFIKISEVKSQLLKSNEEIHWVPEHLKHGRFAKSMEMAPDWNISRNRFWASPLPFWKCQKCHRVEVIGSIADLKEKATNFNDVYPDEQNIDLHRPYIDDIIIRCECGEDVKRITEVIDCWFESGSMPFAQKHYPFENKEWFHQNFPAQFISEYIAQTRTWFYYMHVVSNILFKSIPFEHVVTTGTVLAEDGQKMSKSKGNFPDPWLLLEKYGADSLRFYLLSSPIMRSEDLNFSEKGVDEIYKKIILRLQNVSSFYSLYSNGKSSNVPSEHVLDRWIIARLNEVIQSVTGSMEHYYIDEALRPIELFIDDVSTWYLRRSRKRFKDESEQDSGSALSTFHFVLKELSKLMAPFTPFIAEALYQQLKSPTDPESVHLCDWPAFNEDLIDTKLIEDMVAVRAIVSMGLEARNKAGIKVRQPLAQLIVNDDRLSDPEYQALIMDELNIKKISISNDQAEPLVLDITLTDELKKEGQIRDIIRLVQDARKKAGYTFDQKVKAKIEGVSIDSSQDTIEQETITEVVAQLTTTDATVQSDSITVSVGS